MPPDQPQGTPDQSGQGSGDQPKPVTLDDVNRAITARFSAFEKKIEKSVSDSLGNVLTTKLDEFKASLTEQQGQQHGNEGGKPADSPELKAMQKQLADMSKQLERANQEKDQERARLRDRDLRAKVTEALTSVGISGLQLKHAVGVIVDSEKRARLDDDGERALFRGDDGDELPLTDGVKAWAKSEDAKIYLPPRGTNGSGDRPGARGNSSNQQAPSAGRTLLDMAMGMAPSGQGTP